MRLLLSAFCPAASKALTPVNMQHADGCILAYYQHIDARASISIARLKQQPCHNLTGSSRLDGISIRLPERVCLHRVCPHETRQLWQCSVHPANTLLPKLPPHTHASQVQSSSRGDIVRTSRPGWVIRSACSCLLPQESYMTLMWVL